MKSYLILFLPLLLMLLLFLLLLAQVVRVVECAARGQKVTKVQDTQQIDCSWTR